MQAISFKNTTLFKRGIWLSAVALILFHRITVRLRESSKFGNRVEFLPQASLWSNLTAIRALAQELSERARRQPGTSSS